MDSFEWNKIIGAILGTLMFTFIVKEVASIAFHEEGEKKEAKELAYKIEMPKEETKAEEKKPEVVDFGTLLRQADVKKGEAISKRCLQCHTIAKGQPNKTGPNLWGILGSDIARKTDFNYSSAIKKLDGKWTYERIYKFIGGPKSYVPGTAMTFVGLPRQSQRIDIIAYLRTQSDNPPPIPEPLSKGEEKASESGGGEATKQPAEEKGATKGTETPAEGSAKPAESDHPAAAPENGGDTPKAEDKKDGGAPDEKTDQDGASDGKDGAAAKDGGH